MTQLAFGFAMTCTQRSRCGSARFEQRPFKYAQQAITCRTAVCVLSLSAEAGARDSRQSVSMRIIGARASEFGQSVEFTHGCMSDGCARTVIVRKPSSPAAEPTARSAVSERLGRAGVSRRPKRPMHFEFALAAAQPVNDHWRRGSARRARGGGEREPDADLGPNCQSAMFSFTVRD